MNDSEQWKQHRAFGAVDWASDKHSVIIVDQAGKVIEDFEIEHSALGWKKFREKLQPFSSIPFAIETSRGVAAELRNSREGSLRTLASLSVRLLGELRYLPRLRDEQDGLRDGTQRRVAHGIDKPWYEGGQARPFVHHAKGAVVERSRVSRVVVVQELGLVGGHIDVDRAFAFADFAGQAEIKRFFNLIVFPAAFDGLALEHLPEQVAAGAGSVLFLE
jgi:hypothetical protein